jgi:dipeptidyl aminopeptidase/acylaminoacyl peptidase
MIVALSVVLGRWGWVSFGQYEAKKMADELNVSGNFWGAPMANQANTAFIFGQRSDNGINVYLHHDPTNDILIGAFSVGHFNALTLRLLNWSPDDKWCAYTHDGGVIICDGTSGKQLAALNVGGDVENFAWLSPSQFVAFNGPILYEFVYQQNQWSKRHVLTLTNTQHIAAFSALTSYSVVWRQIWDIWTYDLRTDRPVKVWHSGKNQLVDFSVEANGNILLNCGSSGGSLIELDPFSRQAFDSDWGKTKDLEQLNTNSCCVLKVTSFNNGKGRIYLATDTWEHDMSLFSSAKDKILFVKRDNQAKPVQILGSREIVDYSLQGNSLYIVGSESNEPPRIWRYDLNNDSLTCAYSSLPKFKYARLVADQYSIITNEADKTTTAYRLWTPAHIVSGEKYPLVIAQSAYKWQSEPQIAANCGYYFAMALRPTWGSSRMQRWCDDVMNVYRELANNPNIDTNRVFLYGVSAEGNYVDRLLMEKPELWKGAYLEGTAGPDPSVFNKHSLRVCIVVGREDSGLKWIATYLERAVQNGQCTCAILKEGGHSWLSGNSLRASARSFAEYLTENE